MIVELVTLHTNNKNSKDLKGWGSHTKLTEKTHYFFCYHINFIINGRHTREYREMIQFALLLIAHLYVC